ncbi:MAG: hypothetical protein WCT77_01780 [Bacteroidota bacterium]
MTEETQEISKPDEKETVKKPRQTLPRRLFKYFYRTVLLIIIFFIVISVAFVLLSQTKGFRQWLSGIALNIANNELVGKVYFSDLRINPFKGAIEIDDVVLTAANDTLLKCPQILVDLDIEKLFNSHVFVKRLTFDSPRIKLIRNGKDSSWNFEHIVKPSPDTSVSTADWKIDLREFNLKNSTVVVIDRTKPYTPTSNVAYNNLYLKDMNLKLSAFIRPKKKQFQANIVSLKFKEINSGFELKDFSFHASIDTTNAEVESLRIITSKTDLSLKAKMSAINFFGDSLSKPLFSSPLELSLDAEPICAEDLMRFLPISLKFGGNPKLKAKFSGNLNNIKIENLRLETGNSVLSLTGGLRHLSTPSKLIYKAKIENSTVHYNDLSEILPDLNLSAISEIRKSKIESIDVSGGTDSLYSKIDVNTDGGNLKGWASLGFQQDLSYKGNFELVNVNLSKILKRDDFVSSITGNFDFNGAGTDLNKMTTTLRAKIKDSKFMNYYIRNFSLSASVADKGIIRIDTFFVKFPAVSDTNYSTLPETDFSRFSLKGFLNLQNMKKPVYDINTKFKSLNLASLLKNKYAPEYLNGAISLNGEGFAIDSIVASMKAKIDDCVFEDRALNPFTLTVDIEKQAGERRSFLVNSEFLSFGVTGKYNFSDLSNVLKTQAQYFDEYIQERVLAMTPRIKKDDTQQNKKIFKKTGLFAPVNLNVHADVKDLSLLSVFIKGNRIHSVGTIDLSLDVSKTESRLKIDSINISNFEFDSPKAEISARPFKISGTLDMVVIDSLPSLKNFNLNFTSESDIYINKMLIEKTSIKTSLENNTALLNVKTILNKNLGFFINGKINFEPNGYTVLLDSAVVSVNDSLKWTNKGVVNIGINPEEININSLSLKRNTFEFLDVTGKYKGDRLEDINFKLRNFNLPDLALFVSKTDQKNLETLKGKIDSINVSINGKLLTPEITATMDISNINFSGSYIGELKGQLFHKDSNVTGKIEIINRKILKDGKVLNVTIGALPLNLALGGVKDRFHSASPVDIITEAVKFPLELLSPFVPAIDNLRGNANASLSINGYMPDKIKYTGKVNIIASIFKLQATNLEYLASGQLDISTDQIIINNIELKNTIEEYKDGKAVINGTINLKDLTPEYIDINFTSDKLKVLSPSSAKSMPNLFGDFIVSTGRRPIRFYGTLSEPYLSGDINVLWAELKMPGSEGSQLHKSTFIYQMKGNKIVIKAIEDSTVKTNGNNNHVKTNSKNSFSDLMDYDLNIRIVGTFLVTMDMPFLGQLNAGISLQDNTQPLRYVMKRGSGEPNVTGDIIVKEGSTLKFIKLFNTSGNINFPTGSISNPGLDLQADYSGQTVLETETRNYTVKLKITGTKNKPNVKFSYKINEEEATGDTSKIRENALMLLLFGKTKDDMAGGGGKFSLNMKDVGNTAYSTASAFASSALTDVLQGTGYIQSADIILGNDNSKSTLEGATVRLSGQIPMFKNAKWKVGGTVADITSNNEISIEYPLPLASDSKLFNNFVVQISRALNVSTSKNQKAWELKVKLGGSW